MSYNFETMNQSIYANVRREQGIRNLSKGEKILEYAGSMYNCEFSEEFENAIKMGKYKSHDIPKCEVIDSLVKEWEIWKPYLSADSYSNFIEDGLKSLIELRATATFYSPNLNGYVGNKATVIKEIPSPMATFVCWGGALFLNGKRV